MNALTHPHIQEWLSECRTPATKKAYEEGIKRFFTWYTKSLDTFLVLSGKEMRHIALQYQNTHQTNNKNTVNSTLTALNSFLHYMDKPIDFKHKRWNHQPDLTSHTFSNNDLTRMFDVANTKEKALLSLACSLGWEISAILELDPNHLQRLVDRAHSENQEYIYFLSQRKKTGVQRLGVLNPLCLEWIGKYLIEQKGNPPRKRKHTASPLFDLTMEGANDILKRLARDAQITVTGRIHFHRIRGWVMSNLSRSGMNEFQIKFLVGKKIPMNDMVYLQNLQQQIEERYPQAYEQYLSLKPKYPDEDKREWLDQLNDYFQRRPEMFVKFLKLMEESE